MKFTRDDIRTMARAVNLEVTDQSDLDVMAIRLSSLLEVMETIEQEIGTEMNEIDGVPLRGLVRVVRRSIPRNRSNLPGLRASGPRAQGRRGPSGSP